MKLQVLYDDTCSFCIKCIKIIQRFDKHKKFQYHPLKKEKPKSFILVVDDQQYEQGKALFGLFWHLGGWYKCIGIFHFLPGFFTNPIYKIFVIIKNRSCKRCS